MARQRDEEAEVFKNRFREVVSVGSLMDTSTPLGASSYKSRFALDDRPVKISLTKFTYERECYARSLIGLPIYAITLTASRRHGLLDAKDRKCIVITGRMHASETSGSYTIEGLLKFLLGTGT
jgi:hypothetical protein